jgi:hypothetical protein
MQNRSSIWKADHMETHQDAPSVSRMSRATRSRVKHRLAAMRVTGDSGSS